MLYYFGWINLSLDLENDDSTQADVKQMMSEIKKIVEPLKAYAQLCEIRQMGWLNTLSISAAHNHDINYKDQVLAVYKKIGEIAPGSYGLLYLRLPEDDVLHNEFIVYRLAKGELSVHKDSLLSPCNPTIELL